MSISTNFTTASSTNPAPPDTREAEAALHSWGIEFTKRADGLLEVQNLDISNIRLTKLPDLTCVVVNGHFDCSENKLISLIGAPQNVKGDFSCYSNQLTNLAGCPKMVGRDFYCRRNKLTSLAYISKIRGRVESDFGPFANSDAISPELLKLSRQEIDEIIARAIAPLPYTFSLKTPVPMRPRSPKKAAP
jgi:hypothetical protein